MACIGTGSLQRITKESRNLIYDSRPATRRLWVPRDFVWLAAVETSLGYDSVHIHILLQDLGLDDFKVFMSLIEQFNVFMLSSSVNNKMKGFHLYLAPQIVKTPVEIANWVNYVLKDQEIPKFVYHSRYLNEFKKDTTADIIKALL